MGQKTGLSQSLSLIEIILIVILTATISLMGMINGAAATKAAALGNLALCLSTIAALFVAGVASFRDEQRRVIIVPALIWSIGLVCYKIWGFKGGIFDALQLISWGVAIFWILMPLLRWQRGYKTR